MTDILWQKIQNGRHNLTVFAEDMIGVAYVGLVTVVVVAFRSGDQKRPSDTLLSQRDPQKGNKTCKKQQNLYETVLNSDYNGFPTSHPKTWAKIFGLFTKVMTSPSGKPIARSRLVI